MGAYDQAEQAIERRRARPARAEQANDRRIEQLQSKLANKNEGIAELMEAKVRSKKELGPDTTQQKSYTIRERPSAGIQSPGKPQRYGPEILLARPPQTTVSTPPV